MYKATLKRGHLSYGFFSPIDNLFKVFFHKKVNFNLNFNDLYTIDYSFKKCIENWKEILNKKEFFY